MLNATSMSARRVTAIPAALRRLKTRAREASRAVWNRGIGQRAARGAGIAVLAGLFALLGVAALEMRTGLPRLVDVTLLLLAAWLAVGLAGQVLGWIASLATALPRWLGAVGAGGLLVWTLLLMGPLNLPPWAAMAGAAAMTVTLATLGGSVATLRGPAWRAASSRRRSAILAAFSLSAVALAGTAYWLALPGGQRDLAVPHPTPPEHPRLAAPNPAERGPYMVATLAYGSGTDRRRAEFRDVALRTGPVDLSPFLKHHQPGWRRNLRAGYWGFDLDAVPLNGRVWYPDGEGPFPLVLMVHGNHNMAHYSDPGYAYLGELLASRGSVAVSVDQNFLNGWIVGGLRPENDARAWLLLKHLQQWLAWSDEEGHPFQAKVDRERLALIGHSRGGEAVAIAAAFNRLPRYPDDASERFDFDLPLRAVVAIAPVDGQYRPADRRAVLQDTSYLVLHGSHDADVSSFFGDRQYQRVHFSGETAGFKASVYIHRANHGQFNTVWMTDFPPPASWLLNRQPLLRPDEQQQVARVYISAFLEAALHGRDEYREMFRDHRLARSWLPETIYVTRSEDARFRLLAGFEEDVDVTTASIEGARLEGENLALWREGDIRLRGGASRERNGVFLGWRRGNDPLPAGGGAAGGAATYTLTLPAETTLTGATRLALTLAESTEKPPAAAGTNGPAAGAAAQGQERTEPLDFTVELISSGGIVARLPVSRFAPLAPPLKTRFLRVPTRRRHQPAAEPVLQDIELPLAAFAEAEPDFSPAELRAIRLVFDRTPEGVVIVDRIGLVEP
jgi:dienelactone hydrolase